ncbi:uncharacterized protein J4E79_000760 [Alternaria viburni]|uniref:uncharacterized protein n=1 Tax=Alternaria viburni TaxID=566460 RepID=UPI0020C38527|nr:uncharacterized protein J4E79_000760 [Alternaria viburni]KAI4670478.1 hypothetical protein J4E79_000760 [Alternaria viburni]
MPFLTPKNTVSAAPAFVWDAFPAPPPEAETWQPDADSIARPGRLPDPRFNRDPEHDRRSKSFRREAKMLATTQLGASSSSVNGSSLGRGIGQWPAPAARSTGFPRDVIQSASPASPPANAVKEHVQTSRPKLSAIKPATRVAGPPKGTMESMFVSHSRRPENPVKPKASTSSASPTQSQPPDWAVAIEKAMQEGAGQDTLTASTKSPRPESIRKKSIPPHLRTKTDDLVQAHKQLSSLDLNPNAKVFEAPVKVVDEQVNAKSEALAWKVAMSETGIDHVEEGLRVQQDLLNACIAKKSTTPSIQPTTVATTNTTNRAPLDHEAKKNIMLIRAMEHEMDLEKVAPERELMVMQRAELDRYFVKVCSAHQQWWEAMGSA